MAIKNSVSKDFLSKFVDSISVFDCLLTGVSNVWLCANCIGSVKPPQNWRKIVIFLSLSLSLFMCFGVLKRTVSSSVLGSLKNDFGALVLSTLSFNMFL